MSTIVRVVAVGTVLAASAVLFQGSMASAGDRGRDGHGDEVTLEFDVQPSPFSYTDLGEPGPSAADVIVFHDVLLRDGREVGHEVGSCVVVEASGLSNCTAVVTVDGRGTIAFAFENAPPPRKALAVTGGPALTGTAHGDGFFQEFEDGTATLSLSLVLD